MPLIKSLKPKAIVQNIKTEMNAGKPQKQAIAISYNVKKAEGGIVDSKMIDKLMARRRKKLEASEDFNTSPDIGEQSREQSNQSKFDSKLSPEGTYDQREEALYADGGPITDPAKAQSAQDSMRKAFGYAEGGVAKSAKKIAYSDKTEPEQDEIKQSHNESTSYADGGKVQFEDKSDIDEPKYDSLPYSKPPTKESSFYKPKMAGNQGRATVDLNMYANGGMTKIAYGHGKSEFEDGEQDRLSDEDSSIAMAEGGIAYNPNLKENYKYEPVKDHDETSSIAYAEGGDVAYTDIDEHDQKNLKQGHDESAYAEGGEVKHAKRLDTDMEDTKESHDEDSSIAMAEGGSVDYEKHLGADDEDTEESKDEASSIALAKGGPVQSSGHNPKSGEDEAESGMKKRRRKMMIDSLNES